MIRINKTPEFEEWFLSLRLKEQAIIEARLYRITTAEYFGDCHSLSGVSNRIAELRWKNGLRIYFYREGRSTIRLLLGGLKNGQKKGIKKAALLFEQYANLQE
jgi:putative addiction module killer protein